MAITPRNNVKNTLNKAVPAEVVGLNRAFSSRTTWAKRNQVLKENNMSAADLYHPRNNVCTGTRIGSDCIDGTSAAEMKPLEFNNTPSQTLKITEQYPLVADTPEAVSNKIIGILDLNNQLEDFIHLLQPEEDEGETAEENQENTEDEKGTNEKDEKTSENDKETAEGITLETDKDTKEKIKEEDDDGVKHIFVRRRFGQ